MIRLVAPHHDGTLVSTRSPQLGETVRVRVRVPVAARVHRVHVRSVPDGEPRFAEAVLERRQAGGDSWWAVDVEVRNPVTTYRFLLETAAGPRWLTALGVVGHDVPDDTDFRLVAHAAPPDWAADAVVYQIFPDRFARSPAAAGREVPRWAVPCDWDTPVQGRGPHASRQVYGGDLDGITAHLDHIAAVGANTVYLTPIFPARSNHRYDATSFDRVDPLLGGDEALRRLADAVHARGWRLLGDLTTNHTGEDHPWFTAAVGDVHAGERELYYFDENGDYESWFGVKSLPKLNWGSARLRATFPSIARPWLGAPYGLDGWRVDVANMTGRRGADDHTRGVATLLRRAVTSMRPDALLMAEHAHDATGDLDADGWHGTMNYAGFTRPVWSWLRGTELDLPDFLGVPGGVPHRDGRSTVAAMTAFGARTSWVARTASWQLLGSHDTPRIRTVVGDAARHEVAAGLLMTLPGTPMIFAGDEFGLRADNGEQARTPMPWPDPGAVDTATLSRYAALTRLRAAAPALRTGGLRWAYVGADALVFLRETATAAVLVLARRNPGTAVRIAGPPLGTGTWDNVYGGAPDLHPDAGGAVLLPGDGPTFQVWSLAC